LEHLHHFGLSQDPFSNEPDLRVYFESASHRDAQLRVERGLRQHKGLTLLTGEGGMGKTLLARRVLDALEEEVFEATLLVMLPGAADATGILQRFARQLGVDEPAVERAGLIGQIFEQLAIVREDGRHAVLIVDDAQIMTPDVLSELGGLLSLEYEDRRLVSMLLIGSPELDALVQNDASIAARVEVRVRLQALTQANTSAYVQHRLQHVGGRADLIPVDALDALHKFSGGRPRLVNTLADNALFEAYLAGRATIGASDIERAASDLGLAQEATPSTPDSELAPEATPLMPDAGLAPEAMPLTPDPGSSLHSVLLDEAPDLDFPPSEADDEFLAEVDPNEATAEGDFLELSNAILEPQTDQPEAPVLATAAQDEPLEGLSFESDFNTGDPLELALDEAEFSTDESAELEGVFVELIEE
jgi:general secretion pathway protein A